MFLSFASSVGGNLSELKQQWKAEPPFVFVDVSGTYAAAEAIFNGFCEYLEAIFKAVTEKLPDILKQASKLPDEAEKVNSKAEPEFDNLDVFEKPKAIMYAAKNIQKLGKLPGII